MSEPARKQGRSGRKIVLVFGPLALLGAAFVMAMFAKYGRGNFTRAARIVEARARAYELAAGVARCTNKLPEATLPPSTERRPAVPPHKLELDARASAELFAAEAFRCADFHPRGEMHVQVAWRRDDGARGAGLGWLDDDGDGTIDFEAESIVECAPSGPDRCHARLVEERRLSR